MRRKSFKRKYSKSRGMNKIKTVRWPRKNIGGDRAFTKLFYVIGDNYNIPAGSASFSNTLCMNLGAGPVGSVLNSHSVSGTFAGCPNLSTMAALYTKYRIRGISLKFTYWQTSGEPVLLFTNAQSCATPNSAGMSGPTPGFVVPSVNVTPELRWARTRVCSMTSAGAKPTTLKVFYSVNKVQGPDEIVKNDSSYVGNTTVSSPYFSDNTGVGDQPTHGPWAMYGLTTLAGAPSADGVTGVMRATATVYTEFFGKRISIE